MDANSRLLMGGIAVVAMLVLAATLAARLTGFTTDSIPDASVVDMRQLGFRDLPGGVVEAYDWQSGETLTSMSSGEGAFLRGVVRSLVRQRRGMDSSIPAMFELTRYDDGRVVLSDPSTAESIDLIAFGRDNIAVFAALMDPPAIDKDNAGDPSW
jgi:putative photosynthetic complex assembly protein